MTESASQPLVSVVPAQEQRDQEHDAPHSRDPLPGSEPSQVHAGRRLAPGGLAGRASSARRAAFTVFDSSIARVIGPTPPGTGVMAPATSRTASKSTSPTRPSSVRLVPTSMNRGPRSHHVGADEPRRRPPRRSARRPRGRQPPGRACASGSASPSRWPPAAAAPAACRRGSSARAPPRARPLSSAPASASSSMTPAGRAGHERLAVLEQQPGVRGREPVHVLARVDQRDQLVLVEPRPAAAAAAGCRARARRR